MITVVPIAKAAPAWNPAPFNAPALGRRMGQTVVTTPTTPPGAVLVAPPAPKPEFIDSALVSAVIGGLGAVAYGYLSDIHGQGNRPTWSKIFFGMSAILAVKTLWDITQIRTA